jgi:hypothetical protein
MLFYHTAQSLDSKQAHLFWGRAILIIVQQRPAHGVIGAEQISGTVLFFT